MRSARNPWPAVVVLAALVLMTGCQAPVSPISRTSTPAPQSVPSSLERYYDQVLTWNDCGGGVLCTNATVPLNWDDPTGETASIALVRRPATAGRALGSLLINPGGPGASGVAFIRDNAAYAVDATLAARFDVVGFDPRGVGASTAVSCLEAAGLDSYLYDVTPGQRGSDEWITFQRNQATAFAAACQQRSGPLLAQIDTRSAARDLDVLRAALGDQTLNYLGYSYGTFLGATYADLFPDRVGRLVLDGAIDPAASSFDIVREQAQGFEKALRAYVSDCLGASDCPFAGSVDTAMTQLRGMLEHVDAAPIRAADGRELGANTLVTAIIYPLYSASGHKALSEMFADVNRGSAEIAFHYADAYNGRTAQGRYNGNATEAFLAINCVDYGHNAEMSSMRADEAALTAVAPTVGRYLAYGDILCGEWPAGFTGSRAPITAAGSAPIMVVGTTNDPATPYVWAQALASQLAQGHFVSYRGDGHTAYNKSNSCVNDAVDAYLIDGTVPKEDPRC
ncbi:alpha/beta hydrolase [Rathayibacter toxicus]|uniref:alpha/beta hydrolase n=1 Tax=Rathayibacter toxicus TaxID=145458 RepID=UPI001C0555B6|nr:alpha/beta hydrolase [Rathayibacter toxicus]QWL31760.1 alpha/beta hydrolase [Rathayibacter toxicus]QWL33853.1 alpha/beta hydrolase [Rathayibacter toxicus]QWL35987.1 alpha/beta hydrolase [Rathayibacter toxicus]QWL38077.1 alpha/beta hydrolase [Rathayibacter toxicus]QWL40166.1 alpha/beta hydrolase [Rathayibacter toxicus]